MTNSLWAGLVRFGPITFAAKLYPAAERCELKWREIHRTCRSPLEYARRCPSCGREVARQDVAKAYEHDGRLVVLRNGDGRAVEPRLEPVVRLLRCVDAAQIDPLYLDRAYHIRPDRGATRSYVLLREALARSGKIGVGTAVLWGSEQPVLLRPYLGVLVLHTLFHFDEVSSWREHAPAMAAPRAWELRVAEALVSRLSSSGFALEQLTNHRRLALVALLERKQARGKKEGGAGCRKRALASPAAGRAA